MMATAEKADPATVEEARDQLWARFCDLDRRHGELLNLVDTTQRGRGFLSAAGKRLQAKLYAEERQAQRERLADGYTVGLGESPAPGSIAAISLDAETWRLLRSIAGDLLDHIRANTQPGAEPEPSALFAEGATLYATLWDVNVLLGHVDDLALLVRILDKTTTLVERIEAHLEGEQRELLAEPCPWCGTKSLVVYHRDRRIVCERDPERQIPCVCTDPYCACHYRPVAHRHTWTAERGAHRDGWWGLKDQWDHADRRRTRTRTVRTPNPTRTTRQETRP